jgi:hypothetical protein
MARKARTRKLYSEVEGELLVEDAPDNKMGKEARRKDEKMKGKEALDSNDEHDVERTVKMEEEIVFEEQDVAGVKKTRSPAGPNSGSSLGSSSRVPAA